jgi:hypothetical protein
MTDTEIIETLCSKLLVPTGRHLYGVLGTYPALKRFAGNLQQAKAPNGNPFPAPLSVTRGILDAIPDEEFRNLVVNEARRPEPIAAYVAQAFETFLRMHFKENGLVVLESLEILFAYDSDLSLLRTLATDSHRILLLLPGKWEHGRVVMFPDQEDGEYTLPANLIAENHLWELRG